MERTRPDRMKAEQVAPVDFGVSSDPTRRCKTCACHFEVSNPQQIGQKQSLCRRNGVVLMGQPGGGIGLSYAPTQPDLTCFDGWRPADRPPGDRHDILREIAGAIPMGPV